MNCLCSSVSNASDSQVLGRGANKTGLKIIFRIDLIIGV